MQHSPQEIKSRLDRAVDPEGNVLDMAAVLELVTTLERLPITREALERTRIGKTINLLRKKTNNEVLAKRAKKLVKKWQKLVINQIEASRSVDSPINGSRIASPQINGTLCESDKQSTPTLTDGTIKSKSINDCKKKSLKRKHSGSSSGNSPLTLVETLSQDRIRPITPTNTTSNSKSPLPFTGSSSKNEIIQSKKVSLSPIAHKKPKLMGDKLFDDEDGTSQKNKFELSTTELTNSGNSDSNSIEKDNLASDVPDDINIISNSDTKKERISSHASETRHNVNNSDQNLDKANFSNVKDKACKNDTTSNVNTGSEDGQNHSTVKQEEYNSNLTQKQTIEETILDQGKNGLDIDKSQTDTNSQKVEKINDKKSLPCSQSSEDSSEGCVAEERNSGIENNCVSSKMTLDSSEDLDKSQTIKELAIEIKNEQTIETLFKTCDQSESIAEDLLEPKELVLDMTEEANGINGRFNDNGTWCSWTDMMPYNDGALNILPYVILD